MPPLLEIDNLYTQFFTSAGTVRAVDGISYAVEEGETVAIVGEPRARTLPTASDTKRSTPKKTVRSRLLPPACI